MLFIKIKM